jgi:lipopolysaccharide transport system ATP-binding protein
MSDIVIKVENVGKQYQLGKVGSGTIANDLNRWWNIARGKEDPYLKIGDVNDRTQKSSTNDLVWAIKDINFEVKQGEVLGIIGKNGAGKSTLLKILSRVTSPTIGGIKVKGRIASLLEVGTGFHPELSGRENIFLNGAILGMTKQEIKLKFDEIVVFSGVDRYIDTPVKRYSSGMYVRLAFAVAAHLEPEILIVDEVLAVGDAEFQKKCLGKMKDVAGQGRTVLFVSHNLASLKQFCTSGILLSNGQLVYSGGINDTISAYLRTSKNDSISSTFTKENIQNNDMELLEAIVMNEKNENFSEFSISEDIYIKLKIKCNKVVPNVYAYIAVKNDEADVFIESDSFDYLPNVLEQMVIGNNNYVLKINKNVLPIGKYTFYINFASPFANQFNVDSPGDILKFQVVDKETRRGSNRKAYTSQLLKWEINHVK